MAFSPPPPDLETAVVMGYPAQTKPSKHGARKNYSSFAHTSKPRSNAQAKPVCKCRKSPWLYEAWVTFLLVSCLITCIAAITSFLFFLSLFMGPPYPRVQVSGLNVSGLAATATTNATWKASFLVHQQFLFFGNSSFREMEMFLYYNWDAGQPLASASVDPFVLRVGDRAEINGNMTMKSTADEGAVEEMHRQERSLGMLAVGLGLRIEGTYVIGTWWRKEYGRMQAYCDDLRLVFNSPGEGEGRLDTRHNLPTCTFVPDCYAQGTDIHDDPVLIHCPW